MRHVIPQLVGGISEGKLLSWCLLASAILEAEEASIGWVHDITGKIERGDATPLEGHATRSS